MLASPGCGVIALNDECLPYTYVTLKFQYGTLVVTNRQRVAGSEYAQVLASRIELKDFGQVYKAQSAFPEQAVQGVAGLHVQ